MIRQKQSFGMYWSKINKEYLRFLEQLNHCTPVCKIQQDGMIRPSWYGYEYPAAFFSAIYKKLFAFAQLSRMHIIFRSNKIIMQLFHSTNVRVILMQYELYIHRQRKKIFGCTAAFHWFIPITIPQPFSLSNSIYSSIAIYAENQKNYWALLTRLFLYAIIQNSVMKHRFEL